MSELWDDGSVQRCNPPWWLQETGRHRSRWRDDAWWSFLKMEDVCGAVAWDARRYGWQKRNCVKNISSASGRSGSSANLHLFLVLIICRRNEKKSKRALYCTMVVRLILSMECGAWTQRQQGFSEKNGNMIFWMSFAEHKFDTDIFCNFDSLFRWFSPIYCVEMSRYRTWLYFRLQYCMTYRRPHNNYTLHNNYT
jgi:hypothetical protein